MSIAIVDVRGWQNTLDLKTGAKIEAMGPMVEMARNVLQRHPYPGDMDRGSNRWVSDTALDLIDIYAPRFVFLTYASQYFACRYRSMSIEDRKRMITDAFTEVERFRNLSRYAVMVVGTGDMTPLLGFIDVTGLDGLAVSVHWSARYAGLYEPSPEDMEALKNHPHIERIVLRDEIMRLFKESPDRASKVPEYLMVAHKGYTFRTLGHAMKTPVMIPSLNSSVPIHAPGHRVETVTEIRDAIKREVSERNIALIMVEGVGFTEFPWPFSSCENGVEWFYYEPGQAQYLTIASGKHYFIDYPVIDKPSDKADSSGSYPFSGYFKSIPQDTFASSFPGKSIAVGNRSMIVHMVTGADISVECFARNLYNHGTMAVIHRQDKI